MPAKTYAFGFWFDSMHTVRFQRKAGKLVLEGHDFPETFKVKIGGIGDSVIHIEGQDKENSALYMNVIIYVLPETNAHFMLSYRDKEHKELVLRQITLSRWRTADYVCEMTYNGL